MTSQWDADTTELAAAIAARAAVGATWVADTSPLIAHYHLNVRSSAYVTAYSGLRGWRWTIFRDGQTVTPGRTLHATAVSAMIHAEFFISLYPKGATVAGPYCRFCDRRCFVYRELSDRSWSGHLATCPGGAVHDRDKLGYDHATAINPVAVADLAQQVGDDTELDTAATHRVLAATLRGLLATPIAPDQFDAHIRYLEETARRDHTPA